MASSNLDLPRSSWRLVQTPPARGAWNMAVDEAILEAAGRGLVPPTLRLYAWSPPCLSLGFSQPAADADLQALKRRSWDLVRRPTGGRAILHTDEITYSVCGPHTEPRLAGSVLESYQRLSEALLEALQMLAIPAQVHPEETRPPNNQGRPNGSTAQGPVCFEVPSSYEITARGKKVIGSAQARKVEGVLQHGSLPLSGDLSRILQVLVTPEENKLAIEQARHRAAQRLQERAITIEEFLGYPIGWETAAQAFITAFTNVLNLELQPTELTSAEIQRAEQLVITKYAHPDWTFKV